MKWQPTPVFLLGESHGQRSLMGFYSPWGPKELDTIEQLHFHFYKMVLPADQKQPHDLRDLAPIPLDCNVQPPHPPRDREIITPIHISGNRYHWPQTWPQILKWPGHLAPHLHCQVTRCSPSWPGICKKPAQGPSGSHIHYSTTPKPTVYRFDRSCGLAPAAVSSIWGSIKNYAYLNL